MTIQYLFILSIYDVTLLFVFCLAERFTKTVLQEVAVPIISNFECRQRYQQAGLYQYSDIPDIMLCAGYKKGGKDACQVSFTTNTRLKSFTT